MKYPNGVVSLEITLASLPEFVIMPSTAGGITTALDLNFAFAVTPQGQTTAIPAFDVPCHVSTFCLW